MIPVQEYKMFVEVRSDLTPEEIAKRLKSHTPGRVTPCWWPKRDTGHVILARSRRKAVLFYRALFELPSEVRIVAVRLPQNAKKKNDAIRMRAWREFDCLAGAISGARDEVKHYGSADTTACGLTFTEHWTEHGKPECPTCLACAVEEHPHMKKFL